MMRTSTGWLGMGGAPVLGALWGADGVRAEAAACESLTFGCGEMSEWCLDATKIAHPRKADQDMLDAVLCVLTALRWRLRPSTESLILGDMTTGYMVLPASTAARQRLIASARKYSVPVDGR